MQNFTPPKQRHPSHISTRHPPPIRPHQQRDICVTTSGARFMGRYFPCSIGRGGIIAPQHKREGDHATPAGVHHITGALFNPAHRTRPMPWAKPISASDRWSDDPSDPEYNHMVRMPHSFSHERLWRADPLYDLILLTDWNWPITHKGLGSAIFLHRWRRPRYPTEGCIAFSAHDLHWIARRLTPQSRLIITQSR